MKKFVVVMVIALFIFTSQSALASVDLTLMSTDELITLNSQIISELMDRGDLKEVTVPAGEYVVGEHIPVGEYSVSVAKGNILALITVNEYEQFHTLTEDTNIGRLVLENGDVVSVTGSVVFVKFTGLGF